MTSICILNCINAWAKFLVGFFCDFPSILCLPTLTGQTPEYGAPSVRPSIYADDPNTIFKITATISSNALTRDTFF